MKRFAWTFTVGFLTVTVAFVLVSLMVVNGLEEPVPGWLSDRGGR